MGKLRHLLIAGFLLLSIQVGATDYYIKTGGNDALSGLDDANAWETIAKVTATATSGDTVYFRSQDTWTSSSIPVLSANAGVTYNGSGYGSGTRAKLTTTTTSTITPTHGVVDIYQSNVTFTGFEVDGSAKVTGGIYIGYGATADVSNITVDNCIVHDNGGPEQTPTAFSYGIIIGQTNQHIVDGVTITNTTVYNTGHEGITVYPSRGISTGPLSGNWVKNVLLRGNTVHDTAHWGGTTWGHGIDAVNRVDNLTIEFNTVYNAVGGIEVMTYADEPTPGSPNNVIIRYNLVYDNGSEGINVAAQGSIGHNGSTHIYGNILMNNGIHFTGNYNSTIQQVYNNTVYSNVAVTLGAISIYETSTNISGIVFKNNMVYVDDGYCFYDYGQLLAATQHTNNLYYKSIGGNIINLGAGGTLTAANVTTWEPTAQKTDPLLDTLYHIPSNSPAVDHGTPVGLPYSGSAPDIGAWEYNYYKAPWRN